MRQFGLCLMVCVAAAWSPVARAEKVEDKPADAAPAEATWGHIDMKGTYPEGTLPEGLFSEIHESLSDALARLDKAANDKSLSGVILKINGPTLGWAKLHELRQAIGRIRAKGKTVHAWLEQGTSVDYLLATACDKIAMPESGALMMQGLRAEVSFYKNLFDKLDVKAEILRVGEYKSAAEPFSRTEMSPEFREELEAMVDDLYGQMVATISESRKLTPDQVKAAIDQGPLTAKTAKELGLIDTLAYEDEIEAAAKEAAGGAKVKIVRKYGRKKLDTDFSGFTGMVKMMELLMGVEQPKKKSSTKTKIAVIHATGAIVTGASQSDLFGDATLGAETIIKAVKQAADDATVKAIVLRVDSPGGSALASDLMWRALEKVDKPVVASMGDVAASGGYYISMGADKILAEPGTITGSIGVVGGKVALQGLYEKLGITTSIVSRGKNSGVLSTTTGFSDSEREAMTKMMHDIYAQFTEKAAKGRKMELEKLEKLARGRVYTGATAVKLGLVDEIGTLDDAVARAKELAKIPADEKVERLVLPKAVSPLEALFGPLEPETQSRLIERTVARTILDQLPTELRTHWRHLRAFETLAREPRLLLMPFRIEVK